MKSVDSAVLEFLDIDASMILGNVSAAIRRSIGDWPELTDDERHHLDLLAARLDYVCVKADILRERLGRVEPELYLTALQQAIFRQTRPEAA